MENSETLKRLVGQENYCKLVYYSWLICNLEIKFKPTIDQFDDLYTGLISGILWNLGKSTPPEVDTNMLPDKSLNESRSYNSQKKING